MKPTLAMLALTFLVTQTGCDILQSPPKPVKKDPVAIEQKPTHRFVLTRNPDVAFDTQTGQLCRTWEWEPKNPDIPSFGQFTPTCLSVYATYPTKTLSGTVFDVSKDEQ